MKTPVGQQPTGYTMSLKRKSIYRRNRVLGRVQDTLMAAIAIGAIAAATGSGPIIPRPDIVT